MARLLIVLSAPSQNSFENDIHKEIKRLAKTSKLKLDIIDLYREDFDAIIREYETDINLKMVKNYQEMIESSDLIIFISSVSWNSCDAMTEGFLEKVFTENFAYGFEDGKPVGLLKNKKALFLLTHTYISKVNSLLASQRLKMNFLKTCFGRRGTTFNIYKSDSEHDNTMSKEKALHKIKSLI